MIILNEVKYAEQLIEERKINRKRDINVLTKYFNIMKHMNEEEIINELKEYDSEDFSIYYFLEYVVHNTLSFRFRRPLQILNKDLIFTKGELDYICSFKSQNWQKILFVLFAFSKLYNNSFFFKKAEIIKFAKLPDNCQSYLNKIINKMISDNILDIGIYNKNYILKDEMEARYHIHDDVKKITEQNSKEEIIIKAELLNDDFILYFLEYTGKAKVGYCLECGEIFEQSRNGRIKLCERCKKKEYQK